MSDKPLAPPVTWGLPPLPDPREDGCERSEMLARVERERVVLAEAARSRSRRIFARGRGR